MSIMLKLYLLIYQGMPRKKTKLEKKRLGTSDLNFVHSRISQPHIFLSHFNIIDNLKNGIFCFLIMSKNNYITFIYFYDS